MYYQPFSEEEFVIEIEQFHEFDKQTQVIAFPDPAVSPSWVGWATGSATWGGGAARSWHRNWSLTCSLTASDPPQGRGPGNRSSHQAGNYPHHYHAGSTDASCRSWYGRHPDRGHWRARTRRQTPEKDQTAAYQ